ncbi:glycosyltransferase involved in cell wall biosynthesis [Flavobacterium cutihirudinis]|uniref:Glycosyltransferase involved in cell wall biosynthesis n=1 Tax=Flavobacterium cutihirudinis TaxID=1265740 RepID=A0A3D9FKI2_9FLAO|nr:glycosyltransferase family 4 protein [Flavobacterium cutihirudinis]RED19573.1 glycosyltransferase involved in cell wall biosynthesis [Flavobacterium cutihirudinis]
MKIANVIVSGHPIPSGKKGSWTQRIEYFLTSEKNCIDFFICEKTDLQIEAKTEFLRVRQIRNKVFLKLFKHYRFYYYFKALRKLLNVNDHLIICIVDNVKLKNALTYFLKKLNLHEKTTIIFYNCGYSYFFNNQENSVFLQKCDEMIFLTESAYLFNKNKYLEFIPEVTVLNNPIDKNKFYPLEKLEKEHLLKEFELSGKMVYLWLSYDRDKKGLDLILNAWKDWNKSLDKVVLLVVGAKREEKIPGVVFFGQVDADQTIKFYQLAHVYIFSTLCKEGFGLSLAQAICCNCFTIAANNGGVSEFYNSSNGILLDKPNVVKEWVGSFEESFLKLENGYNVQNSEDQILNIEDWCSGFSEVFQKWKHRVIAKNE